MSRNAASCVLVCCEEEKKAQNFSGDACVKRASAFAGLIALSLLSAARYEESVSLQGMLHVRDDVTYMYDDVT